MFVVFLYTLQIQASFCFTEIYLGKTFSYFYKIKKFSRREIRGHDMIKRRKYGG